MPNQRRGRLQNVPNEDPPGKSHDTARATRGFAAKLSSWFGIFRFGGRGKESKLESSRDIVILVMGPIGGGKSTFINAVLDRDVMTVGHEDMSCTTKIAAAEVDTSNLISVFPWLSDRRLYLVDTPGFDDTEREDLEIVKEIAKWLKTSQVLGGVIYLHDVSIDRFTGTARKTLSMFNLLCGQGSLSKVALGTTKSSRLPRVEASKRFAHLKQVYWKDMTKKGAQVFIFDGAHTSAIAFVEAILKRFGEQQ